MEEDPQVLWRRIGAGDRQAFAALYERHQQDVLRFCHALLRDPDDAREAANSTWAAVWRSRAAAKRDVPLRPWLFRIAHNEAIDILRLRRPHDELDVAMPGPDDPVAEAELHERLATLRDDLLALTDHQRTALVLRELSGLGHDEIGTVLDISPGAAKQTIYEARQALIDAEGGRSLSCDLVRRDISAGDRRVLRTRRIRAHLRTCAACREFGEAVEAQRRRFRALFPAPAGAALLARLGPAAEAVGGGGGATAASGLSAWGARLGGTAVIKVAAAAIGIAAGGGAAAGAMAPHADRAPAAPTAGSGAPIARLSARASDHVGWASRPSRAAVHATPVPRRETAKPSAAARVEAHPRSAVPNASEAPAAEATTHVVPHVAAGPTVPPGRAKKTAAGAPSQVPPGQAKKAAPRSDPAARAQPPGQVKKHASAPERPAAPQPPGQINQDVPQPAAAPAHESPGRHEQPAATPPAQHGAPPAYGTPAAPAVSSDSAGPASGHGHGGR